MIEYHIQFFISLAKAQSVLSRNFDRVLNGVSFHEFIVLHYLEQAENNSMRRMDLAEKLGITPSGMTRMLLPMEKVGLVTKDVNPSDARSTLVVLAPGGKIKLMETLNRADIYCKDLLSPVKIEEVQVALKVLQSLK